MITQNNIEEYIIALLDGELNAAEEAHTHSYIAQHSDAQILYNEYKKCKVVPDDTIKYGEKLHLFAIANCSTSVSTSSKSKLHRGLVPLGIAAAIAMLVGTFQLFTNSTNDSGSVSTSNLKNSNTTPNKTIKPCAIHTPPIANQSKPAQSKVRDIASEHTLPKEIGATAKIVLDHGYKNNFGKDVTTPQNKATKSYYQQTGSSLPKDYDTTPSQLSAGINESNAAKQMISRPQQAQVAIRQASTLPDTGVPAVTQSPNANTNPRSFTNASSTTEGIAETTLAPAETFDSKWYAHHKFIKKVVTVSKQAEQLWASAKAISAHGIAIDIDYSDLRKRH
jgi:hypothetical protein